MNSIELTAAVTALANALACNNHLYIMVIVQIMQSDRIRWWPLLHDYQEWIAKIQLSIGSIMTFTETNNINKKMFIL